MPLKLQRRRFASREEMLRVDSQDEVVLRTAKSGGGDLCVWLLARLAEVYAARGSGSKAFGKLEDSVAKAPRGLKVAYSPPGIQRLALPKRAHGRLLRARSHKQIYPEYTRPGTQRTVPHSTDARRRVGVRPAANRRLLGRVRSAVRVPIR